MAVVAGVVFFILRALLALIPGVTDRMPVKKWAALGALIVTALYLVLSGAEVATQRSFIMIAIVLIGVILDRPVLTLRTVTIAAPVVLFLTPEAVVHPSFQMSFAATLALIAAYAYGQPLTRAGADSPLATRAALWGVNEIVSLLLASLIAGLATTPYAAYHFHRLAPYGVIANLLAMPVVSAWVMPMGILGVVAIPFGFDAFFWRQMGYGIEWMDTVALWVASLPGAFGRVTSFGTGPLLLATAGLLVIGLLKTPLRWSGAAFVLMALVLAARTPVPDVLVAADGRTFAVRSASGKLAFHRTGSDTFATREWLASDADGRDVNDKGLGDGIACSARLYRQARRWPRRVLCLRARRLRRGLPPRRHYRSDARCAAGLRCDCDRTQTMARAGGACALSRPQWQWLHHRISAALNYDRLGRRAPCTRRPTPAIRKRSAAPLHRRPHIPRRRVTPRLPPKICRPTIKLAAHSGRAQRQIRESITTSQADRAECRSHKPGLLIPLPASLEPRE